MASGNLIGCKVHGPALAYSSMDGWVCIIFSKKLSIYIPSMYVSRKTPGNLEGTHELWGTIVCATKYIYIYISQQSMFWRNSWVLGIPTSHILTACKPIYIFDVGKMQFSSFAVKKKYINIFSNQWQLQAFQLVAHLGDKTKVFINDGDPLLKPHSNCLFNTISGWVCPLFPEAYLPQVCVQNRNFCTGNSLLSRLSNGESE